MHRGAAGRLPRRAAAPPAVRYPLSGQLLGVQLDTGELLVRHDAVPGYMDAMTMPFRVADRTRYPRPPAGRPDHRHAGGRTEAQLPRGRADRPAGRRSATPRRPRPVAEGLHILAPGDAAPATALDRPSRRQPCRWRSGAGSAVAVTFIYTRCPLPDFCPLLDRRFAAVQAAAAGDAVLRGRVRLLSVSFDPDADTPEVLAAHAARAGAEADWRVRHRAARGVDRFAAEFGVNVDPRGRPHHHPQPAHRGGRARRPDRGAALGQRLDRRRPAGRPAGRRSADRPPTADAPAGSPPRRSRCAPILAAADAAAAARRVHPGRTGAGRSPAHAGGRAGAG